MQANPMKTTHLTDPFWGNGETRLPKPEGIAATWMFLKAQSGNTHPAAIRPFGMVSACAWTGGYPTGYLTQGPNTHGKVQHPLAPHAAAGFAHFHVSGTGMIHHYYNYVRVVPLDGGLDRLDVRHPLTRERAKPGLYAAAYQDNGIEAELTVTARAAVHRYTFPAPLRPRVAIDLSAGGLAFENMRITPDQAEVRLTSPSSAEAFLRIDGMPIHVSIEVEAADPHARIWCGPEARDPGDTFSITKAGQPFGLLFTADPKGTGQVVVRLGFSFRNPTQAHAHRCAVRDRAFEDLAAEADREWEETLGRVRIEGAPPEVASLFYSTLYHSLVKPMDCHGESPFWSDHAFFTDFATMWDVYKTQLPLVLTLWPERGRDLVNSMLLMAERLGHFPNMTLLCGENDTREDQQARALAFYTILDAFHRHVTGIDWERALRLMEQDLRRPANEDFFQQGNTRRPTHTLDLAGACDCVAQLATALGHAALAREMAGYAGRWRNAFDPETGLLRADGEYYEGTLWNYSFRLLHDMPGRIGLFKDPQAFVETLDRFFGHGADPVAQMTDPRDEAFNRQAYGLHRFEGFNNEPDMETPYAYLHAGRHDRCAEIVRAGMRHQFGAGRGGAPGNVDSGGLSACYVLNAIGLFPVAGQPILLIGSPILPRTELRLPLGTFVIEAIQADWAHPYVRRIWLNGRPLGRTWLHLDEFLPGGTLRLEMSSEPVTPAPAAP